MRNWSKYCCIWLSLALKWCLCDVPKGRLCLYVVCLPLCLNVPLSVFIYYGHVQRAYALISGTNKFHLPFPLSLCCFLSLCFHPCSLIEKISSKLNLARRITISRDALKRYRVYKYLRLRLRVNDGKRKISPCCWSTLGMSPIQSINHYVLIKKFQLTAYLVLHT